MSEEKIFSEPESAPKSEEKTCEQKIVSDKVTQKKSKNIYWIGALLLVGLISFYGGANLNNGNSMDSITGNAILDTDLSAKSTDFGAADFSVKTIDGAEISLKKNVDQGKPTVLYFMSSTCSTCAKNWAALNEVYPDYEDKVDFVAVSVDPTDTDKVLKDLREDKSIIFDMSAGNPELALAYKVKKQTAKFAIDKDGNVVSRHDGALSTDEWGKFFDQLLGGEKFQGAAKLEKAPNFSVTTIDGKTISLSSNKDNNKPTVLYFMSSTCSTCAKNWAAMNEVYPEYEGKVDLVAISVDPTDTDKVLKDLREDKSIIFDMSAGNPQLALAYKVKKQTAKFAIDAGGNIVKRHDGALTADEWKSFFDQL